MEWNYESRWELWAGILGFAINGCLDREKERKREGETEGERKESLKEIKREMKRTR
jgi:hypothetical protein